jgi:Protein of unknown function (DUF4199)
MKNTIIKFGLISGGISAIFLTAVTLILKYQGYDKVGFENSAYFGYGSIIIAMSVVYFGIKSHRNSEQNPSFTFWKGFLVGLGIVMISCIMYSLAWMVIYYNFIPNFMDDYAQFCVKKATDAGASQTELKKTVADLNQMKEWYKSPVLVFLITLTEPLPVGLLVAVLSAFSLRRK